jgi:hypothetical protein
MPNASEVVVLESLAECYVRPSVSLQAVFRRWHVEAMEAMGEWRKQLYVMQQDVGRRPAAMQVAEACLHVRCIVFFGTSLVLRRSKCSKVLQGKLLLLQVPSLFWKSCTRLIV